VRELEHLPTRKDRERVVARVRAWAAGPRPPGCEKLSGREDRYRVRQGACRIVYSVNDRQRIVTVVAVGHRKDVYQ
jgi:mRNA interferase RelE/StbE